MKKAMLIVMLGCLPGCSLLSGGKPNVENVCKDATSACSAALLVCGDAQERAALSRASGQAISKSVLQCDQVHKVCDEVMEVCGKLE